MAFEEHRRWKLVPVLEKDDDDDDPTAITIESSSTPAPVSAPSSKLMTDDKQEVLKELSREEVEQLIVGSFKNASLRQKALTLYRSSLQYSVAVAKDTQNIIYNGPTIIGALV